MGNLWLAADDTVNSKVWFMVHGHGGLVQSRTCDTQSALNLNLSPSLQTAPYHHARSYQILNGSGHHPKLCARQ